MKLTLKVITIFFVSVLCALAVMAAIGINLSIRQATQNLKETADVALTSLATTLSEDIGTAFSQIEELTRHEAVTALLETPASETLQRQHLEKEVQDLFSHYTQFNSHYLYVYLGTKDESIIVDKTIDLPDGYTPIKRPWYTSAQRYPGQTLINDIYKSIPDGHDMASISRGIFSQSGKTLGVVSIDFLFSRYQTIMQNLAFQSGFIVITHNNASVIAHSQDPDAGFTRLSSPKNTDLRHANNAVNGEIVTIKGKQYTAYIREISRYKLKILTFISETTIQEIRTSYILLYSFTAAVILLIVGFTGSRLARTTLQVEQASIRAKHDFFKNMNHEIRTPLNAVIGFIELLTETPLGKKQKTYLGHTETAAKHLSGIVNDVLDLSSMRAGKYRIVNQEYLFHDLIGHIVALVEQTLGEKPIRLHVAAASGIPHALRGDSMRLKQVLLNILHNAVKFTDEGVISLRIGYRVQKGKPMLEFTITDTGSGIAEEHLPHIFDEFTQFSTREVQGTGLGLTLTRLLVERMGGRISCVSTPGKGTRFCFHVPQGQVVRKPSHEAREYKPSFSTSDQPGRTTPDFSAPNASVLLVEDDVLSRTMMTELLGRHLIKVHTAETGQAFLDAMTSGQTFHLVLTDMKLPDINGREVTRRLRDLCPPIPLPPIIAFSAADAMAHLRQGPFDACFRKPINIETFRQILLTWLPDNKIQLQEPGKASSITDLDASGCEAKYGNALYLTLLQVFREEHEDGFGIMEEMIREERFSDLEVRVHRFKGALMNIGAHGTAEIAAALENRLEAGETISLEDFQPLQQAADKIMNAVHSQIVAMEEGAKNVQDGLAKSQVKNPSDTES